MRPSPLRRVAWACGAVSVAALTLDLSLPLGAAGGIPYAVVVLVAGLAYRRDAVVAAAFVGSVLALVGYALSPQGGDPVAVLLNRIMALALLWVMAAILIARGRSEADEMESEGRFRRIVDASPDGILMVGRNGTITLVNEQAVAQFGYTRDELIGQPMEMLMPTRYRAGHPDLRGEYADQPYHRLIGDCSGLYGCRKDGTEFPVEIGLNPIDTREGSMVMATVRDITSRRRAEEAAQQLRDRLQQATKMEAIGQLAGGVAHDFNNLLTVIRGRTELLLVDPGSPDRRSDLEQIRQAADHAASLTHQLLAFSRKQVLEPRVLGLGEVVLGIEGMMRRLIPESIDLVTNIAPQLDRIRVDRNQLEQVILNLTVNARDAMSGSGRLTLDVHNVELTEDFVSHVGAAPSSHVLLAVHDTGAGMNAETQSRIFEPFFTTKEGARGTGLGLATVYGIVKQSGGYIQVFSEVGRGTTFEVYFPKAEEESDERLDDRSERPSEHAKKLGNVLIVEDDPSVRRLMRDFLGRAGHKVLDAEDCADAIRICEGLAEPVDLLVTDVVMPDMSGPKLAERLTSLRPDLKVLFVSGYVDESVQEHLTVMPDTPFLPKPFTSDAFTSKVEQILASS